MILLPNQLPLLLEDFHLSTIPNIHKKRSVLQRWANRVSTGWLDGRKEESIDSEFIADIFSTVLDYHQDGNPERFLDRERKTDMDGQKPDAAIGYFDVPNTPDIVRGVVEMKGPDVDLDEKQRRPNETRTPVEQAIQYAPKFRSRCNWVFVSNFREIRLYQSSDQTSYEHFKVDELLEEDELKRFLFLCSRARLITTQGLSPIDILLKDRPIYNQHARVQHDGHIIDKIYFSLRRFEGLRYFDPNILANTQPFHKGSDQVWHHYKCTLASAEADIYSFFRGVKVENNHVQIETTFKATAEAEGVLEVDHKAIWIMERLNQLLICRIECYEDPEQVHEHLAKTQAIGEGIKHELRNYADQLRSFSIQLDQDKVYPEGSLLPAFDRFDYRQVLRKLYAYEGSSHYYTPESLYLHSYFGTNDFKSAYSIANVLLNRTSKDAPLAYFTASVCKKLLHNLIRGYYWHDDQGELLDEIKAIDLIDTLGSLSIYDPDVRTALNNLLVDRYRQRGLEKMEH